MIFYPAVDIMGGRAVRLVKGDFASQTVYEEDPAAAAEGWVGQGAKALHVVDLDGARAGEPRSIEHLERIARLGAPVQYGGGVRSLAAIEEAIAAGAERVVLGTAAFSDPELLGRALAKWGERIVVSVDARGGRATTEGWTESAGASVVEAIETMRGRGVGELVYTDVDRDGMLQGPDIEGVAEAAGAAGGRLIYSGGIGALADLRALAQVDGISGVIAGKALYEGRFTVGEALEAIADGDGK